MAKYHTFDISLEIRADTYDEAYATLKEVLVPDDDGKWSGVFEIINSYSTDDEDSDDEWYSNCTSCLW